MGDVRQLSVTFKCSAAVDFGKAFSPFAVSGDLVPSFGAPVSTDLAAGYVTESGNCWLTVTYYVPQGDGVKVSTGLYFV